MRGIDGSALAGHVALVTGGNGGIGLGMAKGLTQAGADVAIWATNAEKNEAAAGELCAAGDRVAALRCDVRDESQVAEAFRRTVEILGKVDSVFANAAIGPSRTAPFVEMTLNEWREVAVRNQHYAASKISVVAIIRGLAVELARYGIRCNTLVPGWTQTDMMAASRENAKFVTNTTERTPVRRWGDPSDFGPPAVYLADPSAIYHTGDTVVVDGGYTIF